MPQKLLSLPAIAAQLRTLCQEKKSGTLYIFENGRSLGQLSLGDGEIIACWTQKHRGIDALPILRGIQNASIAFVHGAPPAQMNLPPTADILAAFERASSAATPQADRAPLLPSLVSRADPPSQLSKARPGKNPLAVPLTATAKTVVEQTLKEFIGPIAKIICTDCFRFAPSLDIAVDALAKEIPDPEAAFKFRERVQQRLG